MFVSAEYTGPVFKKGIVYKGIYCPSLTNSFREPSLELSYQRYSHRQRQKSLIIVNFVDMTLKAVLTGKISFKFMKILLTIDSSSSPLPLSQIFEVDHSYPKPLLDTISHTISPHIILNHIQSPLFGFSSFFAFFNVHFNNRSYNFRFLSSHNTIKLFQFILNLSYPYYPQSVPLLHFLLHINSISYIL